MFPYGSHHNSNRAAIEAIIMSERKIQVFLYGSAINLDVLASNGLKKRAFAPASLTGFDLIIQPVANIVENGDGIVFGILANFTHAEIELLTQ